MRKNVPAGFSRGQQNGSAKPGVADGSTVPETEAPCDEATRKTSDNKNVEVPVELTGRSQQIENRSAEAREMAQPNQELQTGLPEITVPETEAQHDEAAINTSGKTNVEVPLELTRMSQKKENRSAEASEMTQPEQEWQKEIPECTVPETEAQHDEAPIQTSGKTDVEVSVELTGRSQQKENHSTEASEITQPSQEWQKEIPESTVPETEAQHDEAARTTSDKTNIEAPVEKENRSAEASEIAQPNQEWRTEIPESTVPETEAQHDEAARTTSNKTGVEEVHSVIKTAMRRNFAKGVAIMNPDVVLDLFEEKEFFGENTVKTVRDIREKINTSEKNRDIFERVTRNPSKYPTFKECLAATSQIELLDVLEKTEECVHTGMLAAVTEIGHNCTISANGTCEMMDSLKCNRKPSEYFCLAVKDVQNRLISLYSRHHQKIPIFPLIPEWRERVEKLYVRPHMVEMNSRGVPVLNDQICTEKRIKDIRNIFYADEKSYRDIYLVAESGSGKSTLCEYLVHLWVKQHSWMKSEGRQPGDESIMEDFSLLFYISLRDANRNSQCNVEDMIRYQLEFECVKNIDISNLILDYKCLIILDGLDEYSLTHSRSTQNISASLPWRRHSDNCTIITTSRPWKMELLASELGDKIERQIRITGLELESQERLVYSVITLLNSIRDGQNKHAANFFYDMKRQQMDKYMETPILLMQMLGLWFEGESFGMSQCEIYSKMIEKQIQFAVKVRRYPGAPCQEEHGRSKTKQILPIKSKPKYIKHQLPACFSSQHYCHNYQGLLLKLSKLAYVQMFGSQESALVFDHYQMEIMGLSEEEIQSCLHLGLLTQYTVFGNITQRQKSISFVHKSYQEFFSAMYLWEKGLGSDLNQLLAKFTDLDSALHIEKVFTFVSGMNPNVSQEIAKVIVDRAAVDPRIRQYRQVLLTDLSHHVDLIQFIQCMILAAIEESISNSKNMPAILLQDIWMEGGHRCCPPSRILACKQSLDLSNVKSVVIKTPSSISRDEVWQLLKNASPQLIKLDLYNCYVNVSMVQKILKRNRQTLQSMSLYCRDFESLDFSVLTQSYLTRVAALTSLCLNNVILKHEQLECFYKYLGQRPYREINLARLYCKLHGYSCEHLIDLSASTKLQGLTLFNIPVQDVVFVPVNITRCEIGRLPDRVAAYVVRSICAARSLEAFICHPVGESTLIELVRTLPSLATLRAIRMYGIDFRGKEQYLLNNMKSLHSIGLFNVTLTATQVRQLLASLPCQRVYVVLGHNDKGPVTIADYNMNEHIIEQLTNSPNTKVETIRVSYGRDQCVVKTLWFYHERKQGGHIY